eukprot:1418406-Amphidinium_carterae.2
MIPERNCLKKIENSWLGLPMLEFGEVFVVLGTPTRECNMPRRARPMLSSFRPTAFNAALWIFLSMVGAASGYHAATLLKTRESGYAAKKHSSLDCGLWSTSNLAGSSAAWQHGVAERHGAVLAWILAALHEQGVKEACVLKTALAAACAAKNSHIRRAGLLAHETIDVAQHPHTEGVLAGNLCTSTRKRGVDIKLSAGELYIADSSAMSAERTRLHRADLLEFVWHMA